MIRETQILTSVINYLNEKCEPFSPITTGNLPPNGGISAEIASGFARSEYLDRGAFQRMQVLILIRNQKHKTALETAFKFADAARMSGIDGLYMSVGSAPEFVQRSGADYIYSLIINVDYLV